MGLTVRSLFPEHGKLRKNLSWRPRQETESQQSQYRNSRLREICDGTVKSSFNCQDWCELNGWYDSEPLPPPTEEGGEPPPTVPVWLAKGKAMAAFSSAVTGNQELENLVQGFQLSEEERKEPEIILKYLKEHFTANEGVLTERTKFAQMKQEPHESVTAWKGRLKEHGRRLDYSANCEDQLLRDKFISEINNERLSQNYWIRVSGIKQLKKSPHLKQCSR